MEREMTRFCSETHRLPHSQWLVYNALSSMETLAKLREFLPADKLPDIVSDEHSCTLSLPMLGTITIRIAGVEAPTCIAYTVEGTPIEVPVRVCLTEAAENETHFQLIAEPNLNPFIKPLLSKPIQEGLDKVAEGLASLPYDKL
jgi:hypothetical protein